MRVFSLIAVSVFVLCAPVTSCAEDAEGGRLLIIGGGLRPDNTAVYSRLVSCAGGRDRARFGLLATAGTTTAPAEQLARTLQDFGISSDRIRIIDLTVENAERQAFHPDVLEQIRSCTGLFFTGGDQRRIVRALVEPDGAERPALKAIRDLLARGGVIAGSSAGAAIQSDPMLAVSGLPDDALDEGMDALDFGLTTHPSRRGLHVTRGLGFFRAGLVDQHFNQFRGRLSRLARAATEKRIRFGFGVDENTAMDVSAGGGIEVVGAGCVTVVDTSEATCEDGPLGCVLKGVRLSSLEEGDRFDPKTGVATVAAGKELISRGAESTNGNHLIADIAGPGAVYYALTSGLADNTARKQVGVTLKYSGSYGHGYKLTFVETDESRSYGGYVNRVYCFTVLGIRLDVEPIVATLQPSRTVLPADLPTGVRRRACEAVLFRGILLADEERRFRPDDPISRGDFAAAMARAVHLEPPRRDPPAIPDVPESSALAEDVVRVVGGGLMTVDSEGDFHPSKTITRQEAAAILVRLSERRGERLPNELLDVDDGAAVEENYRFPVGAALRAGLMVAEGGRFRPASTLSREEAAVALGRMIGFTSSAK